MTRENIKIAALRLFLLRGYKDVSLMDVARELEITKGGIYHYFASKEELLHEAVHFLFQRFEERYITLFQGTAPFREILRDVLVKQHLEQYLHELLQMEPDDYRLNHVRLAMEIMPNFPELQQQIAGCHAKLVTAIERKLELGQASGEIRSDIDAGTLAMLLYAMLNGQKFVGMEQSTPQMRQQTADSISQLICA